MDQTIFDIWNRQKQKTEYKLQIPVFKEREIYAMRLGKNIGTEQDGKGSDFIRPVLIFKKFSNHCFWGVPLSKTLKRGRYYFPFYFKPNLESVAIISQLRLLDSKRLERKLGMMSKCDFSFLKKAIIELINDEPFVPPPKAE